MRTNRKRLRELAFDFIDNIGYQSLLVSKDITSNNYIKINPLKDNSGLKDGFWNVNC